MLFRKTKVRRAITKIGLGAILSDGMTRDAEITGLALALTGFPFMSDITRDECLKLINEAWKEIKRAAVEGRFVEEIARSCMLLKKGPDAEAVTAFSVALFVCLSDGELRGTEVGYIEMLTVNLGITRAVQQTAIDDIRALIERTRAAVEQKKAD